MNVSIKASLCACSTEKDCKGTHSVFTPRNKKTFNPNTLDPKSLKLLLDRKIEVGGVVCDITNYSTTKNLFTVVGKVPSASAATIRKLSSEWIFNENAARKCGIKHPDDSK